MNNPIPHSYAIASYMVPVICDDMPYIHHGSYVIGDSEGIGGSSYGLEVG